MKIFVVLSGLIYVVLSQNHPAYNPNYHPGYNPNYHSGYNHNYNLGYNPNYQHGYNPYYNPGYNQYYNQHSSIVRYHNDNPGNGQYSFGFETTDGTRHDQTGFLANPGTPNEGIVVKGSYSYVGPDGKTYTVFYTADENGFRPEGAHIPQAAGVNKYACPKGTQGPLCVSAPA